MRSGKRLLAGAAAGALTAGLIPFAVVAGAGVANATTYSVALGFPSLTIIQTADDSITVPVLTYQDGVNQNVSNTAVVMTLKDTATTPASALNDDSPAAGTNSYLKFSIDDTMPTVTSGAGAFNLYSGTPTGPTGTVAYTGITAGNYTLTASLVSTSTSVVLATTSAPIAVVSAASAGSVTGTGSFVEEQAWDADAATSPQVVASDDTFGAGTGQQTWYVKFVNGTGGPIVSNANLFAGAATPNANSAGTTTANWTFDGANAAPGVYSMVNSSANASGRWNTTSGAGSVKAFFANPLNQITGTQAIAIDAAATMGTLDIDSAISASAAAIAASPAPDDSLIIPATNGVKFTVSGIMSVAATATAGVNVSFAPSVVNGTNGTGTTSYSAISPAIATTVTSDSSGLVSQEFTVTNPVNGQGVRITATYPGGSKTFFVKFTTPATTTVTADVANLTANTSGDVTTGATVTDTFDEPVANVPVAVSVAGTAATSTPTILTTDADGRVNFTWTVPAGTASGATSVITWGAWNGSNYTTITDTTNVTYTTGGGTVSTLTVTGGFNSASTTSYAALTSGALNDSDNPLFVNTALDTTAVGTNNFYTWGVKAVAKNAEGTVVAGAPVVVTPADGGWVISSTGAAATSRTFYSDANGEVGPIALTATKTGVIEYNITTGGVTQTVKATFANRPTDARYVAVASDADKVNAGSGTTVHVEVSDRFGNAVAGVPVSIADNGPGYFPSTTGTTSASGSVEFTFITVAEQTGTTVITGAVSTSAISVSMPQNAPSSADQVYNTVDKQVQVGNLVNKVYTYTFAANPTQGTDTVTGVTAGNATAVKDIQVVSGGAAKSIQITGERTTVKNKPGIAVDGLTTGFDEGAMMVPHIKFPGQTSYSEGSARPTVDVDGEFYWQRKTGKKIYIYFSNEDGDVRSDRIIIQAK